MAIVRAAFSFSVIALVSLVSSNATSSPATERLVSGQATTSGAVLVAGDHGARYELRGGAVVDISPGSEFSFEPSLRVPLGEPGQRDTLTRVVRVIRGGIDVSLSNGKRDQTPVMIRGPGKMSSVTRAGVTTFMASGERSTVGCRSGDALVGVGNDWKPLKEGFARTLAPEDPGAMPRRVLEPPAPDFDHGLVFVHDGETGSATASWQSLKEAKAYDVTLTRTVATGTVLASHETTTSTSAPFRGLSPGTYSIVVAAVDKYGLPGTPSQSKSLRVAGLEVPEGAVIGSAGAIILAKEQRVRLIASEGLEIAYGSSQIFRAAPSTLGLAHNGAVVARLRAPGTTDETLIRLAPRGLSVRANLSPKTALWPRDTVHVTVELSDKSEHPVREGDVQSTITVNLKPVKLDWQRSGRTLRATIPPPASEGPWVVRIEVRDKQGELLGRDFLEVAKNPFGTIANR
jgi:hypothetical protein